MDLGEAMVARLSAAAVVTALAGTRIHWVKRDQKGELPAIVMRGIGGPEEDAPLDDEAQLVETRVQVDCLAKSHDTAWRLARAVRAALKDEAEVGDMLFWHAEISRPIDLGEDTPQGFEHRASMDCLMRHSAES